MRCSPHVAPLSPDASPWPPPPLVFPLSLFCGTHIHTRARATPALRKYINYDHARNRKSTAIARDFARHSRYRDFNRTHILLYFRVARYICILLECNGRNNAGKVPPRVRDFTTFEDMISLPTTRTTDFDRITLARYAFSLFTSVRTSNLRCSFDEHRITWLIAIVLAD